MTIWRVQLKPEPVEGISYNDVLEFCQKKEIIGVGWYMIESHSDSYEELRDEVYSIPEYKDGEIGALRAVNAVKSMQPGDLVWTRLGGTASEYYLCKVGDKLWTDRVVTDEHRKHDIGNFVSAQWVKVGKEDKVPGKVVNSFCARGTAQRVYEVDDISKVIWNVYSDENTEKYELPKLNMDAFWNMIGSEELECLVLLYLQSLGYYIFSSTLKISTATFEAALTYNDGSHLAYPQVKRNIALPVENYVAELSNKTDKIYLFTTSEAYGVTTHPQIQCIYKNELEEFVKNHRAILPASITYWLDIIGE